MDAHDEAAPDTAGKVTMSKRRDTYLDVAGGSGGSAGSSGGDGWVKIYLDSDGNSASGTYSSF